VKNPGCGRGAGAPAGTVRAVLEAAEVHGIRDGFEWIMQGDVDHVVPLTIDAVSRIHFRGGSHIGISRANPTRSPLALIPDLRLGDAYNSCAVTLLGWHGKGIHPAVSSFINRYERSCGHRGGGEHGLEVGGYPCQYGVELVALEEPVRAMCSCSRSRSGQPRTRPMSGLAML